MSTSRDSLIGLRLSSDSSTASSRERSWTIRAIRNRYFARSAPGSPDHTGNARRAAATARSTSSGPASATSASTSSEAGLTVLKVSLPGSKDPSMNSPYDGAMSTIARDSGAGAYSNIGVTRSFRGEAALKDQCGEAALKAQCGEAALKAQCGEAALRVSPG